MTKIDPTTQLWAEMALSYDPSPDAERPPKTFALLGYVLHFYRAYNYRICEWRPGHYAVASVIENWGVPVFIDRIPDQDLHDRLSRRVSHSLPAIGEDDILLLV